MFKCSLPLSLSLLFGPSLPAPSRFCALQGFCCRSGWHSGILWQQKNLLFPIGNCKFPPCCSHLKSSLFMCVPQVEAVPPGAEGRVGDGPVHLCPGAEGHRARVRGRHRHAAHGSPPRRDGDRQRWALRGVGRDRAGLCRLPGQPSWLLHGFELLLGVSRLIPGLFFTVSLRCGFSLHETRGISLSMDRGGGGKWRMQEGNNLSPIKLKTSIYRHLPIHSV